MSDDKNSSVSNGKLFDFDHSNLNVAVVDILPPGIAEKACCHFHSTPYAFPICWSLKSFIATTSFVAFTIPSMVFDAAGSTLFKKSF